MDSAPSRSYADGGERASAKRPCVDSRFAAGMRGPSTPSRSVARELSVVLPDSSKEVDPDLLLQHLCEQTRQTTHLQIQVAMQSDIIRHLCRCLAMYTKRSEFEDMPPPYNPLTDQAPIPNPKSERESDFRDMTSMELTMLEREIRAAHSIKRVRDSIRRIVSPDRWYIPDELVEIDVQEMPNKIAWKIWVLLREPGARLDSVLTADEMVASKPPACMSRSALTIAVDKKETSIESPAVPVPLHRSGPHNEPGPGSPSLKKTDSDSDLGEAISGEEASDRLGSEPPEPPRISGTPVNAGGEGAPLLDARSDRQTQAANAKVQREVQKNSDARAELAKAKPNDFVDSDEEDGDVSNIFGSDDEDEDEEEEDEEEEEEEEKEAQQDHIADCGDTSDASGV